MTRAGCSDLNWPLLCTRYSKNDTIESRMSTRYSSKSSFSEFRTSPLSFSPQSSNSKRTGLCGRKLIIHQRMNLAPRKLRSNFSSSRGNTKRAINKRYPRKTLENGGIPLTDSWRENIQKSVQISKSAEQIYSSSSRLADAYLLKGAFESEGSMAEFFLDTIPRGRPIENS